MQSWEAMLECLFLTECQQLPTRSYIPVIQMMPHVQAHMCIQVGQNTNNHFVQGGLMTVSLHYYSNFIACLSDS